MRFKDIHKIKQLKSDVLRKIAGRLVDQMVPITFYGQAWSKATGDWVYFDTVLDLEELRKEYALGETIVVHENHDPKSGTERGFIDTETGEGLMGKLPK